jgi:hypothetical protein
MSENVMFRDKLRTLEKLAEGAALGHIAKYINNVPAFERKRCPHPPEA